MVRQSSLTGCVVYDERTATISYFNASNTVDCLLEKGGNYLLMYGYYNTVGKTGNPDFKIINLNNQTASPWFLFDVGLDVISADTGYGFFVSLNRVIGIPLAYSLFSFATVNDTGTEIFYSKSYANPFGGGPGEISWPNAQPDIPLDNQWICGASATSNLPINRFNEITCFSPSNSNLVLVAAPVMTNWNSSDLGALAYKKNPNGCLDPTGEYFLYLSNLGNNRSDLVMVRIPYTQLVESVNTSGYFSSSTPVSTSNSVTPSFSVSPNSSHTNQVLSSSGNKSNFALIVGVSVGGGVLLIVILTVIVVVVVVVLARRSKYQEEQPEIILTSFPSMSKFEKLEKTSYDVMPTNRSPVESSKRAPLTADWEIQYEELVFTDKDLIGSGAFGEVFKGSWRKIPVAIKQLKADAIDATQLKEFREEIALMKNLRPHSNVVLFFGACVSSTPYCLVIEYLSMGSLLSLIQSDKEITKKQVAGMLRGAAAGIKKDLFIVILQHAIFFCKKEILALWQRSVILV